jgi:hypothetical protein
MGGYLIEEKQEVEKHKISDLLYFYFRFSTLAAVTIKDHLNLMSNKFRDTNGNSLTFTNPSLYLDQKSIATTNEHLTYSFLMFRAISGTNAYKFQPDHSVSFKNGTASSYDNNDLLNSFKYRANGNKIEAFITTEDKKKTPNPEALKIFKEDKEELGTILNNIFTKYGLCNLLKSDTDQTKEVVCTDYSEPFSPDYYLEFYTCLEVFNLAENVFCPTIFHDDL